MLSFFIVRTSKLISMEDPFFSMTTMALFSQEIDLYKLDFYFAVEEMPPEVGRVQVSHVKWDLDSDQVESPIEMAGCDQFSKGGKYEGIITN